jgi:outer membrane protein assembly factor BamB
MRLAWIAVAAVLGCSDGGKASAAPVRAARAAVPPEPGDWPTFLGPDHTGVSRETGLLKVWPEKGPPERWRIELGETYASPSVVRDSLVVFHRLRNEEVVECLDPEAGRKKWRFAYGTAYRDRYNYNGGPRSQPTIDDGRVYTLGAEGKLHCLDLGTGNVLWSRSLLTEIFQIPIQNYFGVGVAPRIDGEAILLNLGDERQGCVVGIDKKTGKTLWKSGEDGASYSSAICAEVGKSRLAIFLTREGALGCSVADGTIKWSYPFRSRDPLSANAASPVVLGDKLFLTAAYGVGSVLLKMDETGVKEVWRNKALSPHWATPVHIDGHLYGFDGRHEYEAELRCVRVSDGEVLWSQKGYERGSITLAEGKAYILAEGGKLVLAELSPKGVKEISSAEILSHHCWNSPVLSRGLLYLLRYDHSQGRATLICLDAREKK